MPEICRDKLPGGYASLGLIVEPGHDLPIGVSRRRRLGIDQVGLNCAVCHTGTVREAPGAPSRIVLGMPAHQIDLQAIVEFVLDCTLDNRLTADSIRGRFPRDDGPSAMERLLLRAGLVDRLKLATLDLEEPHFADPRRPRPSMGTWAGGHVQSVQGHPVQLGPRAAAGGRAPGRVRLPVAVESGAARGHAPALGRRQRFGGRAEPERLAGGWRHAGDRRSRGPAAHPELDLDAASAGVPVRDRCRRCRPRRTRLPGAVRGVPRRPPIQGRRQVGRTRRPGGGHRSHRHRPASTRLLYAGLRGEPVRAVPRFAVPLQALPQDGRVHEPAAGRHLGPRAVPPQRLGPDAARSARAARAAARRVLPRLRRVRPAERRVRRERAGRQTAAASSDTTRRWPGNGNGGHVYGTTLPDADKQAIVEYLKRF